MSRRRVFCSVVLATALVATPLLPRADAEAGDTVTITSVNGAPASGGSTPTVAGGSSASVGGTAQFQGGDPSPLVAEAGDSIVATAGAGGVLMGAAFGGSAPYTYSWTAPEGTLTEADGASVRYTAAAVPDMAAVPVTLTVRDADGATATDVVVVSTVATRQVTLVDTEFDLGAGLPEELVLASLGGTVDGSSVEVPFNLPTAFSSMTATLAWGDVANDLDMYVTGPSPADDANSAATGAMPEVARFTDPVAGDYVATVHSFLSTGEHATLVVTAETDVLPALRTDGPFRLEDGAAQRLSARNHGAGADIAWDLDFDGIYETPGATVSPSFELGTHMVAVQATTADGFTDREVTAVRVVPPGSRIGNAPVVVIAVSDSGVNAYHREFSAATYPDDRILELTEGFTRHPSEYIPGYPAAAKALPVTLDAGHLPPADAELWTAQNITEGDLYWIPGTKIIGARDADGAGEEDLLPILDEDGHGTGSASVATGNSFGNCPTCLLVANEANLIGSEMWVTGQDWIDFSSNSFGAVVQDLPTGSTGLFDPVPASVVERGQTWLYASGNGQENAFVVPNTTYTTHFTGPDWIVRVGAADSGSRQPVVGDGSPVDVSSWGTGQIPSASVDSVDGVGDFSGTSSATPLTAGGFGTLLAAAREALGDSSAGQSDGVVASGSPVAGSPYLGDGVFTRTEMWEILFKTAQPGGRPATEVSAASTTFPFADLHYVFEGYGIVDPSSIQVAVDVLLGRTPLPERPEEDAFFQADSALRAELYGEWQDYRDAYGESGGEFAGVLPEHVATLAEAMALLTAEFGPFEPSQVTVPTSDGTTRVLPEGATGPLVSSPDPDATVERSQGTVAIGGLAGAPSGTDVRRWYSRYSETVADDGTTACGDQYATVEDGDDPGDGCRNLATVLTDGGSLLYFAGESVYPMLDGVPVTLDATRLVTGTVHLTGNAVGSLKVRPQLRSGGAVLGEQHLQVELAPDANGVTAVDFAFPVRPAFAGRSLDRLEFGIVLDRVYGDVAIRSGDQQTFIDVPLAAPTRTVDVSVDGVPVATTTAEPLDGSWLTELDVSGLALGAHTIDVTVTAGGEIVGATSQTLRVVDSGTASVEVAFLRRGVVVGGWTPGTLTGPTFLATVTAPTRVGPHELVARLVVNGGTAATSAPVSVRVTR